MPKKPLYYADYIQLDKIIGAQAPESALTGHLAHDEHLFIVTHQSYELWFKQILFELTTVQQALSQPVLDDRTIPTVVAHLERISIIQQSLLTQINILETMTPMDFLEFRDLLMSASGFQSVQFRLIEARLGLQHDVQGGCFNRLSTVDRDQVNTAIQEKSLFDLIEQWLERLPFLQHRDYSFWTQYQAAVKQQFDRDKACLLDNQFISDCERAQQLARLETTFANFENLLDSNKYQLLKNNGDRRLSHLASSAALFILLYRDYPVFHLPYKLLSVLLELDNNLATWRYRHYQMVMRMIGVKVGTGGSAGADYLHKTINQRIFDDIANLTVFLVSRSALPALPAEYDRLLGFHYEQMAKA